MKTKVMIICALCIALLLSGCCLSHDWQAADCEHPQTCAKCGETKGETLGHDWREADCEHPQTCAKCGETRGEALGHDWQEADCEHPKTCARCGKTEGEAPGHEFTPATLEHPKTCSVCGITEGEPVKCKVYVFDEMIKCVPEDGKYDSVNFFGGKLIGEIIGTDELVEDIYSVDGVFETSVSFPVSGRRWSRSYSEDCFFLSAKNGDSAETVIYNYEGELLFEKNIPAKELTFRNRDTPYLQNKTMTDIYSCYIGGTGELIYCYDLAGNCELPLEEYNKPYEGINFDSDKWANIEPTYGIEGAFLVSTPDETQWGFVDGDGNVLMMYTDVSAFTKSGYALASNDREEYMLIDKDFNVIEEHFAKGSSAYYEIAVDGICVTDGENWTYYVFG